METTPPKTTDKVLETTTHKYLEKPYSVVKETKNRKILYTGIVKLSDTETIKHTCKRKRYAKENCKREIRKSQNLKNE